MRISEGNKGLSGVEEKKKKKRGSWLAVGVTAAKEESRGWSGNDENRQDGALQLKHKQLQRDLAAPS